jgi:hypothetical protein
LEVEGVDCNIDRIPSEDDTLSCQGTRIRCLLKTL